MVVLFIVAAISVLSFGYVVKADRELSCAENTDFRMEMDYLGQTALNHAKMLVLNPQDVTTGSDGYWQGGENLQIESGDDYYDISVAQAAFGMTKRCTYDVTCNAYRNVDGVKVSETNLQGQLRLDPCIAYWAGNLSNIPANMLVRGDVYCNGSFASGGPVNGDVFANSFFGFKTGQLYSRLDVNVGWPDFDESDFSEDYYIDGVRYEPVDLGLDNYIDVTFSADEFNNPAGIFYRNGDLTLSGNVIITGTLVLNGNLNIESGFTVITAEKNYPAIVVGGKLGIRNGGRLSAQGLVHAGNMEVANTALNVAITGALFIEHAGIVVEGGYLGGITVTADPMLSAIKIERVGVDGHLLEWTPVGGAYYKSIKRY